MLLVSDPQPKALRDLLDLARRMSIDPPTPPRRIQWQPCARTPRVCIENECATLREDSGNLAKEALDILEMKDKPECDDRIKGAGGERERERVRLRQHQ